MTLNEQQQRTAAGMSTEDREKHIHALEETAAFHDKQYEESVAKERSGEMLLFPSDYYAKNARVTREDILSFRKVWHDFDLSPVNWQPFVLRRANTHTPQSDSKSGIVRGILEKATA